MVLMVLMVSLGVFDEFRELYVVGGGWGCDSAFFEEHPYIRKNKMAELEAALRSTATTVLVVGAPYTLKTMCINCVRCAGFDRWGVGCHKGPGGEMC
jgi:hypothetical protein